MNKIKICTKCGSVFGNPEAPAFVNGACLSCQNKLLEIDVDVNEFLKIHRTTRSIRHFISRLQT